MMIQNNKVRNPLFAFGILFLAVFMLSLNFVGAASVSTPQLFLGNLFTPTSNTNSVIFNQSMCAKGQDFVVQVSPLGCQPTAVRSDLLEQQNSNVWCPLSATQLNPLVKVNSISDISFSGKYSPEVNSIGFYPAQAALNTNGQSLNYPVLSNIGYLVVNLKQQPNESSMPNFVTGNVTATLKYNANNAFGIGETSLYLPQMSDTDWNSQYSEYGFWNNKGYLRVDSILGNQAMITVYDKNLNKASTVSLTSGQTSGDLSIPGFDLCSAMMKIKLDGIENANTMAKLDINGNIIEVAQGENFLNNQCYVRNIDKSGLVQDVQISCNTDLGYQTFDLKISPKVAIEIDGKKREVTLGSYLFTVPNINGGILSKRDQGKSVYLGYIGYSSGIMNNPKGMDMNKTFIVLAVLPRSPTQTSPNMTASELSSFATSIKMLTFSQLSGNPVLSSVANVLKVFLGEGNSMIQFLATGRDYGFVGYNKLLNASYLGHSVKFDGFAGAYDEILSQNSNVYYKQATGDYNTIQTSYSNEKYPSSATSTLGEQALYYQIYLSYVLNQKYTLSSLCEEFQKEFPKSSYANTVNNICKDEAKLSNSENANHYITINGQAYVISLDGISEPSYDQFGAEIKIQYPDGHVDDDIPLSKDEILNLNATTGDFIQLNSLTENTATLNIPSGIFGSGSMTLTKGVPVTLGQATGIAKSKNVYILTLENVNLEQLAEVTLLPQANDLGSSANFTFNISIEKRSIQLSPDKIKEQIKNTNATIAKLETISNATGKVYSVLSDACTAADYFFTAKNFWLNLQGAGLARMKVMTDEWNGRCKDLVSQGKYKTLDDCFIKNSAQIDKDVNLTTYLMNKQNAQLKALQDRYTTKPPGLSLLLSSGVVNTSALMMNYSVSVQASLNCIGESQITNPSNSKSPAINVSYAEVLMSYGSFKANSYTLSQAKDVQLYADILCLSSSTDTMREMARNQLYSTLSNIQTNSKNYVSALKASATTGIPPGKTSFLEVSDKTKKLTYEGLTMNNLNSAIASKMEKLDSTIKQDTPIAQLQTSDGKNYILVLDDSLKTSILPVKGVYNFSGDRVSKASFNPASIYYQKIDASAYQNTYKSNSGSTVPEIQYFETAPYKGVPAIVPFDLQNGWYAAIKQTQPTIGSSTTSTSVDSSGRVESFWLCNVGANGIEEFNAATDSGSSKSDDQCQSIDLNSKSTYTNFNGLDSSETTKLVGEALSALQQAQTARTNNPSGLSSVAITINGKTMNIKVGPPAANVPAIQCEDFMSPSDCNVLFNLCDPVVCPTSRCDFGGAYPVSDVVQTGIIGSTLLCLPNSVALGGTDYVPVCLPGIKAGIDNYISIEKSYAQCLQNNLNTGETTGICGEIWDIYDCNLFWQNAVPFAKLALNKVVGSTTGQGASGGGEYLNVQNAISTAQQSMNYMTNTYDSNSLKAFQSESTQGIGVGLCQNFIQTVFPSEFNIANKLSTPDSPPQFSASFSEIQQTTATVPPTSQYNVYYHIYAGQNSGVYYSVYLKNSGSSYYQDVPSVQVVNSGYIIPGGSADQTKVFTAPSGYTQVCITVNGQENCGFKQVTSNLLSNYIQGTYVADQVNNSDITTSTECDSGTIDLASISNLLNLNLQAGTTNLLHPSIKSLGITRICATGNPGASTDPNANTASSRWVQTGYCDNTNVGCWLDTQSVENVINSPDIMAFLLTGNTSTLQNNTLQSLQSSYMSVLLNSSKYLTQDQFDSKVQEIQNEENTPNKVISDINAILSKVFYNNDKGFLLLLRGNAYGQLALGFTGTASGTFTSYEQCIDTLGTSSQVCPSMFPSSNGFTSYQQCTKSLGTSSQVCDSLFPISSGTQTSAETTVTTNSLNSGSVKCVNLGDLCLTSNSQGLDCCSGQGKCLLDSQTSEGNNVYKCKTISTSTQSGTSAASTQTTTTTSSKTSTSPQTTTTTAPETTTSPATTSGVTASDVLKIMNYANPSSSSYNSTIGNRNCLCGDNEQCTNYSNSIFNAAKANGENPLLLLSIMMQESDCRASVVNGNSIGLMQISTYKECESIGISSIADVTGAKNYDNNIKCGAYILKDKYNAYNGGTHYPYPSGTCDGFSATYTGWDAAIRGYLGYGCANNPTLDVPDYVNDVNLRISNMTSILASLGASTSNAATAAASSGAQTSTNSVQSTSGSSVNSEFVSPVFSFSGVIGSTLSYSNLYYQYYQGNWHWSSDQKSWNLVSSYSTLSGGNLKIVQGLNGKSYGDGLNFMINAVLSQTGSGIIKIPGVIDVSYYSKLLTKYVSLDHNYQVAFAYLPNGASSAPIEFDFRYSDNQWQWKPSQSTSSYPGTAASLNGWVNVSVQVSSTTLAYYNAPTSLINQLVGKDFDSGAQLIFDTMPAGASTSTSSESSSTTSSATQLSPSQTLLPYYREYGPIFDNYTKANLDSGLDPYTFEALIFSIAQKNNFGGSNGDLMMGYHVSDSSSQSANNQVRIVASILAQAFNGNGNSLPYASGNSADYSVCNPESSSGFTAQANCILSVYETGQPNSGGKWYLFGGGANTEGIDYANQVMSYYSDWVEFLKSSNGPSYSPSLLSSSSS